MVGFCVCGYRPIVGMGTVLLYLEVLDYNIAMRSGTQSIYPHLVTNWAHSNYSID